MDSKYIRFAQGFIQEFPRMATVPLRLPSALNSLSRQDERNKEASNYIVERDSNGNEIDGLRGSIYYHSGGLAGIILGSAVSTAYLLIGAAVAFDNPDFAIKLGVILTATNTASYLYERFKR